MKAYILKNENSKGLAYCYLLEKVKNETNIIQLDSLATPATVAQLILKMAGERDLFFYSFESLSLTMFQYYELKEQLMNVNITIHFLKEAVNFNESLDTIYCNEKAQIKARTKRGLENARAKGNIGGRPKILESTQNEIARLYKEQKMTLREIADKCNISVGTAYKYAVCMTQ